jgi:hypothetical protein
MGNHFERHAPPLQMLRYKRHEHHPLHRGIPRPIAPADTDDATRFGRIDPGSPGFSSKRTDAELID